METYSFSCKTVTFVVEKCAKYVNMFLVPYRIIENNLWQFCFIFSEKRAAVARHHQRRQKKGGQRGDPNRTRQSGDPCTAVIWTVGSIPWANPWTSQTVWVDNISHIPYLFHHQPSMMSGFKNHRLHKCSKIFLILSFTKLWIFSLYVELHIFLNITFHFF